MIKINLPPRLFLGHLYLEYIGSNMVLLNSEEGRCLKTLTLSSQKKVYNDEMVRNCFEIEVIGNKFLIAFDGYLVFKLDTADNSYKRDVSSVLSYFETYINKDLFMVVGRLIIYNEINENDHRHEPFKFVIVLEKSESLTNLFI
jgi:hypothetical protein